MRFEHTWVGLVAVFGGDVTIVAGVCEYDGTNGTVILGVLNLETTEETTVFNQSNLALEIDAELNKSLEVIN